MKLQKIMGLALAGTMLFAAAAPVFAADGDQSLAMSASAKEATMTISTPTGAALVINPYHLKAQLEANVFTYEQILSTPSQVTYASDTPVKVSATVTATISSSNSKMKLASAAVTAGDTGNNIYIAAQFSEDQGLAESATAANVTKWSTPLAATAKGASYKNDTAFPANGTTANSIFCKLVGSCSDTAAIAWTDSDKVDVSIAYSFIPQPMELAKVKVSATDKDYTHSVQILGVVVGDESVIGAADTEADAIQVTVIADTGKKTKTGAVTVKYITPAGAEQTMSGVDLTGNKAAGVADTLKVTIPSGGVKAGSEITIIIGDGAVEDASPSP